MSEEKVQYVGTDASAKREKYWDELGIEEKVERMRWVVNQRHDMVIRRLEALTRLLNMLERHEHNGHDGRIVIPLLNSTVSCENSRNGESDSVKRFF